MPSHIIVHKPTKTIVQSIILSPGIGADLKTVLDFKGIPEEERDDYKDFIVERGIKTNEARMVYAYFNRKLIEKTELNLTGEIGSHVSHLWFEPTPELPLEVYVDGKKYKLTENELSFYSEFSEEFEVYVNTKNYYMPKTKITGGYK